MPICSWSHQWKSSNTICLWLEGPLPLVLASLLYFSIMISCLSRGLSRRLLLFPLLRSHRFICIAPFRPYFSPSLLSPLRPLRCAVTMLLPTLLLSCSPDYLRLLLARCCTSHPLPPPPPTFSLHVSPPRFYILTCLSAALPFFSYSPSLALSSSIPCAPSFPSPQEAMGLL